MTRALSKQLAEAAHAAIREQYKTYLEPYQFDNGSSSPGIDPPTLVENYADTGHWAISWEEGPDEWAMRAFQGGFSEELYTLGYPDALHVAKTEKGLVGEQAERWAAEEARKVATEQGAPCPKGVFAEPYYSFVLMLYPTD